MCQVRGTQTADEKFSAGLSCYQTASMLDFLSIKLPVPSSPSNTP